ncbi:MAG: 23S rRNA (uracil(1939)-C(5))-methyltransferase RlmD [Candidatus Omnitrophica bacterium]|nr:23S rRNA (uracil(1939)-C(5))-methyltransferase RlmD [Candidatus Omnitrophota bacterium]
MNQLCRHFGDCGGCRFQDVEYCQQLINKENLVKELIEKNNFALEIRKIHSYQKFFYRNKMEFSFSGAQGSVLCGLYSGSKDRRLVNLEECLLFSKDIGKILNVVRAFGNQKGFSVFNKYSHRGFLRNLIVRETKFTAQTMVAIVTTSEQDLNSSEFVEAILNLDLEKPVVSIFWIKNDSWSDAVVFEKKELIFGQPFIQEELDGLFFNIGVDSFFQVNPQGIKELYQTIRKEAALDKEKRVLDLFCGVGSIGIFLAKEAEHVFGVELHQPIVEAAIINAENNKVGNITFFAEDTRRFLNLKAQGYKNIDCIVLNPPRSGLSKKIIRAVLRLEPAVIFYSSCNPKSMMDDLSGLVGEYDLDFIEPFDFFPHTPHLECLVKMKRNRPKG